MRASDNGKTFENGDLQKVIIVPKEEGESNGIYRSHAMSIVDVLLSIFVVTPLVVFTWRGSWQLMDLNQQYFPYLGCFIAGMVIHVILAVSQQYLHRGLVESEKHWTLKLVSHFLRRCYTYVFLTCTILHWRGCWGLVDNLLEIHYTSESLPKWESNYWILILWATSFATLISIKGLRNAIAPPFAICIDKGDYVFRFPTMFESKSKHNLCLYALDSAFSVGVMGNLVIVFWKTSWIVSDVSMMFDTLMWSSWTNLFVGLFLVGLTFRFQNIMKSLCANRKGFYKVLVADFYITMSCVATICYWKGTWGLVNVYLLPNTPELSCAVSHIAGFMFLVVLNCSNSLLVRGVYKDGKEPNGECVVFPCQYLRIILEREETASSCEEEKMLQKVTETTN